MITRVLLLLCISWIVRLDEDLFHVAGHGFSGHDLILLAGGLFLIAKATFEIHEKVEGHSDHHAPVRTAASFANFIVQILLVDMVFSLDSVITAVGMARAIPVMFTAVILAVFVMLVFAGAISGFVERHPTVKILALSFLVLIGVLLVAEGFGKHIEKGYVYFAMAFALSVELVNLRVRGSGQPVHLHQPHMPDQTGAEP
jgi:predicted tellurium resistance membrane protein TerC